MAALLPPILLIACAGTVLTVFAVSAGLKLRGRSAYAAFRDSLPVTVGVPPALKAPVATTVIGAEAAVALLLGLGLAWWPLLVPGFVLAGLLLAGFSVAIGQMLRRGVTESCFCFGAAAKPPSVLALARNLGLLAITAAGVALAGAGVPPALPQGAGDLAYLWLAVLAVGAVSAANLVLGWAVLRQLRRHSELLRMSIEGVANPKPIMLEAGGRVGAFTATTIDGQPLDDTGLASPSLVGFVSPTCPACAESLPGFILRAMDLPRGREQALAVIVGAAAAAQDLADRLAPVARVVIEPEHGPVARAFKVDGVPAFALLSEGTVVASHFVLDRLPELGAPELANAERP